MKNLANLLANWPAPANISALATQRAIGASLPPYNGNNLALHVGDNPQHVQYNRHALVQSLKLPNQPIWLNQTHSTDCIIAEETQQRDADAAISRSTTHPLAIMTADCLPILLCDRMGTEIAAIHAGWRGLLNGIVENTLHKMHANRNHLMAWIGPAICHQCYATGEEVRDAYIKRYPYTTSAFYTKAAQLHANLPKLAELILQASGVVNVYQSNACSFELKNEYYSYRREPQTGRMATLIWFNRDH